MTKFDKTGFDCHVGYLTYRVAGEERARFVARFKYRAGDAASFRSFLTKHFTVAEYFERMANNEAPLTILESKGYVLPHIRRWLRKAGLPETQEGQRMLVEQRIAARGAA
ncbi:hypothetical protein BjapCC829_22045 [Bradyrhizobium barranii]|uniref:Uncharacterized protein n=1 Tax=Bradyrhizobium barranii TaxID=2992140 RepID=A0ABY3QZR2_9BRAD|nr:hypothetical protein [Bradyrhizobium japonicum]UFW91073.1 hypothetical protein BjapCC829_22045 [Bradyrhizobium japonicum]